MSSSSRSFRSFLEDIQSIQTFCKEHRVGFGAEDKEEDDDSKYTIAYETVNNSLVVYMVEDETEETDQIIIDSLTISVKEVHRDILTELLQKCKDHKIIS
jgi:hypothetical protein